MFSAQNMGTELSQIEAADLELIETLPLPSFFKENTSNNEHEKNRTTIFIIGNAKVEPISHPIRRMSSPIIRGPIITSYKDIRQRRHIAWEDNKSSNKDSENLMDIHPTLEDQKVHNEGIAISRKRDFENIIANMTIKIFWGKGILYTLGTISAGVLCTLPLSSLFPLHNLVLHPEYWYIPIYTGYVLNGLLQSVVYNFCADSFLNIIRPNKLKAIIIVFMISWVGRSSILTVIYLIWSVLLEYPFPLPFMGIIITGFTQIINMLSTWFQYPSTWRENHTFSKSFKYFVAAQVYHTFAIAMYSVVGFILLKVETFYQPFVACILPLLLKINVKIYNQIIKPASNGDSFQTTFVATFLVTLSYTLDITVKLGSITTFATGCTLMVLKLLMDFWICFQIIQAKRKTPEDINNSIKYLQKLVLNEIVEFICPTSFMLSFLVAYNGKNAPLMGGIGSSKWQYNEIEDVYATIGMMMMFFVTDLSSVVVCSLLLWVYCKINFFKAVFQIIDEFGLLFIVLVGYVISMVSNFIPAHSSIYSSSKITSYDLIIFNFQCSNLFSGFR